LTSAHARMAAGRSARAAPRRWLAVAALTLASAASAQEIRIGGTGGALGAMRLLATAYAQREPGARVTVADSLGTSGAIKAVARRALDIGLTARELDRDEMQPGIVATEYARSPLVFAVSPKTPVSSTSLSALADIYSGRTAAWPDGQQTRPVLRQAGDGTTKQLRQMSPAMDLALTAAEQRPGMPFAVTDQEAADKTEAIPGALGLMSLGLILSEQRALRPLRLDGVEPTLDNLAAARYPWVSHYYMLTQRDAPPAVQRFIAYTQSADGRAILLRAGNLAP